MKETDLTHLDFEKLADEIVSTYQGDSGINFIDVRNLPVREKIIHILDLLIEIMFPGYTGRRKITRDNVRSVVHELLVVLRRELSEQIELALRHQCRMKECPTCDCTVLAANNAGALLRCIPHIRETLKTDIQAAFDGDPAAQSFEEIVISYPYITAISIHRIAHELYRLEVPLLPRIMSECAHSRTGIDIHPGARIGRYFFIDHGTGVVIGETAVIGDYVKIYQGVTVGAISFPRDERGLIIRGQKRHPTLEDNVTVYAEATLLGNITIGKGAVIGGNVWIRESVPPGTVVMIPVPESLYKKVDRRKKSQAGADRERKPD
ncbi:MAG: serine acetyltransferase [Planctomycetales bacterium]|nr:serine acetyltransferase [Planctomycetales bacterium]